MRPIENKDEVEFVSTESLRLSLTSRGCRLCELGFQPEINGCCVARGPDSAIKMIVGEAPGKEEDSTRQPFTGPAGKLLDEIWNAVGMKTSDWYLTNVVLCRPVAKKDSGKENHTPHVAQRRNCRPFLDAQISLVKPKIIVTLGKVASEAILGPDMVPRIGDVRGKIFREFKALVFPMLHPAAILHSSSNPKQMKKYKQQTWDDVRSLKRLIDKENI